jgi:hypothetical protein
MTQETSGLKVALTLMRMALALLDRADAGIAAARLQHAIDDAESHQRRTKTSAP